jgi:hypothetical protein
MRFVKDGVAYELTNPHTVAAFQAAGWKVEEPKAAEQPKPKPRAKAKAKTDE